MKTSQRLAVRRSEITERLAAISETDGQVTEEVRSEHGQLASELKDLELKFQAAVASEEAQAETRQQQAMNLPNVPKDAGLAEVRSRASLLEFVKCAAEGRAPGGAEAELRDALIPASSPNRVPLVMLADPDAVPEERAISGASQPTRLDWRMHTGLFRFKVLDRIGVMPTSVATGQHLYTAFRSGTDTTTDTATGTTAAADSTLTAVSMTLPPTRLTSRIDFQVGESFQTPSLEREIRSMLSMSMSDRMERDALVGGAWAATSAQAYTAGGNVLNPVAAHASGNADAGSTKVVLAGVSPSAPTRPATWR